MGSPAGPPLVIWDPALLSYQLSPDHPLNPIRLRLTVQLASELGVLKGITPVAPVPADDELLQRIHTSEYIAAVKAASVAGIRPAAASSSSSSTSSTVSATMST